MQLDYGKVYDADYFQHHNTRTTEWLQLWAHHADRIIRSIGPLSVLDAGCARGLLVEALRDRGVEAFGVDVSPHAIGEVRDDIKPHCRVGSLTEPFPRRYDLIVCHEVLEHLPKEEGVRAIANLCAASDDLLIGTTPGHYHDPTHINVQPPDYWATLFAEFGFFHDVEYDASFLSPWAVRFRKAVDPLPRVVAAYERKLWLLSQEVTVLRGVTLETKHQLTGSQQAVQALTAQLTGSQQTAQALTAQLAEQDQHVAELRRQVGDWERHWNQVQQTNSWRLAQQLRRAYHSITPASRAVRAIPVVVASVASTVGGGSSTRVAPVAAQPIASVQPLEPAGNLAGSPEVRGNILDEYVRSAPSAQNALDIFKDEWASKFPAPLAELQAGAAGLFEDPRIAWGIAELGGVADRSVLELGPLEGGHSYMLEQAGAASVIAIEANTRAYLKCLVSKELLQLKRVQFLCGDFMEYLRANRTRFDLCVASGVLYHMRNPIELIARIAGTADRLVLWTHYYDEAIIARQPHIARRFADPTAAEHEGFRHTLHRFHYAEALAVQSFCGGTEEYSSWLSRDDILTGLEHFGFGDIHINYEQPDHPNGPCFTLVATR